MLIISLVLSFNYIFLLVNSLTIRKEKIIPKTSTVVTAIINPYQEKSVDIDQQSQEIDDRSNEVSKINNGEKNDENLTSSSLMIKKLGIIQQSHSQPEINNKYSNDEYLNQPDNNVVVGGGGGGDGDISYYNNLNKESADPNRKTNSDNSRNGHRNGNGNRLRRSTNRDLLLAEHPDWNIFRRYHECGPNCASSTDERPFSKEDVNNLLLTILAQTKDKKIPTPFTYWAANNFNKLHNMEPDPNILNNVNLSGRREVPLYAEEPHYVLIRREDDSIRPDIVPDYTDDPFIPPRGRKHMPILKELLNHYELFFPHRGKRDKLKDLFKYDDLFFPNRGKRQAATTDSKFTITNTKPMIDFSSRSSIPSASNMYKNKKLSTHCFTHNRKSSTEIGNNNYNNDNRKEDDQLCQNEQHELDDDDDDDYELDELRERPNVDDQSGQKETSLRQRLAEDNLSMNSFKVKKQHRPRQRRQLRELEQEQRNSATLETTTETTTTETIQQFSDPSRRQATKDFQEGRNRETTFYSARQRGRRSIQLANI